MKRAVTSVKWFKRKRKMIKRSKEIMENHSKRNFKRMQNAITKKMKTVVDEFENFSTGE
jgi:hypothetical protein